MPKAVVASRDVSGAANRERQSRCRVSARFRRRSVPSAAQVRRFRTRLRAAVPSRSDAHVAVRTLTMSLRPARHSCRATSTYLSHLKRSRISTATASPTISSTSKPSANSRCSAVLWRGTELACLPATCTARRHGRCSSRRYHQAPAHTMPARFIRHAETAGEKCPPRKSDCYPMPGMSFAIRYPRRSTCGGDSFLSVLLHLRRECPFGRCRGRGLFLRFGDSFRAIRV